MQSISAQLNKIVHLPHQLQKLKKVEIILQPGLSSSLQKQIDDAGGLLLMLESSFRKGFFSIFFLFFFYFFSIFFSIFSIFLLFFIFFKFISIF